MKNLTKPDQITSETEWPQFIHPDGGIIKITPWGTLRQFVDPKTNETITKFEDCSLEDYSFKLNQLKNYIKLQILHNQYIIMLDKII